MVIHIASLMRVNLHNTGKYPHKHIQLLANQQPIPTVKKQSDRADASEMKVGHTSSAEASMISYIYKCVRDGGHFAYTVLGIYIYTKCI